MPHKFTHKREVLVPDTHYNDKLKEIFNACGLWILECSLPINEHHGKGITVCLFDEQGLNAAGKKGHKGWIGKSFTSDDIRYVVFPDTNGGISDTGGFERAIGVLNAVDTPKGIIRVITTRKELDIAITYLKSLAYVVCDFETTTIDPFSPGARVLTLAAGNKDRVYVMPMSHKDSPWRGNVTAQRDFIHAVYFSKHLVAHNAKFELRWFLALGQHLREISFDPMVVHHLLDENSAHDLETLTAQHTKFAGYSHEFSASLEDKHNYESAPFDRLCQYNGMDVLVTDLVAIALRDELAKVENEQIKYCWDHINRPLIHLLAEMEHAGFILDEKELDRLIRWYETQQSWYEVKIKDYKFLKQFFTDRPDFNFNSTPQMQTLLYNELKFKPMRQHMTEPSTKFPKGQPSTNKEAIKAMKVTGQHKTVLDALSMRVKCASMLKSFLYVFRNKIEESTDGVLHTNFNQHIVETFRLSSSGPNMMNLPRSEDLAALGLEFPKRAFISRFDGGELIQADLSQIELRVAGMYSKDPVFVDAFAEGRDLHGEMAERVYGKGYTKEERYKAKRTNFSAVFDIGAAALAPQIDSTVDEAQELIDSFKDLHVVLFQYFDELWAQAQFDGFVTNFLGRKRHIFMELSRAVKQHEIDAVRRSTWNFPIQSSAADIMLSGMLALRTAMIKHQAKSVIIGMVHDSIIVDAPLHEVKMMMTGIKSIFENLPFDWLTIPVKIDVAHGPNLHDLEDWEP